MASCLSGCDHRRFVPSTIVRAVQLPLTRSARAPRQISSHDPPPPRACRADEDPSYRQTHVTVTASSGFGGSEPVTAFIYAWPKAAAIAELDMSREWSYTEFRAHHMASFTENVVKASREAFEKQEGALEVIMTDRSHRGTPRR